MICKNCGKELQNGVKFCTNCGTPVTNANEVINTQPTNTVSSTQTVETTITDTNTIVQNNEQAQQVFTQIEQPIQQVTQPIEQPTNQVVQPMGQPVQQPTQTMNNTLNNNIPNNKISFMGYFFIILTVLLKPFTALKEELNKFDGFKNSAIMALIVSGVATIVNLITSMLNVVMIKSYDWSSGGYKTTWTWENLKELNYLEVIGKNFLIYLGIIIAIAAVYYIAGLIVKKQPNFPRLLGISAFAVAPILICSLMLSPLLSLIWAELAMPITLIGAVYTIVLLYEGMNSEVLLDGNAKYYFNLVCLSVLGIAAYYLYMKLFMSSVSSGLEDIMKLFG